MKRVLIADDNHGVQQALQLLFSMDGRIETLGPASSLAAALDLADQADAVVLDLHLTDSDGAATAQRFRERAPHTPIVVYSATEKGEAEDAAEGYADACVPKGEVRALVAALEELIELSPRGS